MWHEKCTLWHYVIFFFILLENFSLLMPPISIIFFSDHSSMMCERADCWERALLLLPLLIPPLLSWRGERLFEYNQKSCWWKACWHNVNERSNEMGNCVGWVWMKEEWSVWISVKKNMEILLVSSAIPLVRKGARFDPLLKICITSLSSFLKRITNYFRCRCL